MERCSHRPKASCRWQQRSLDTHRDLSPPSGALLAHRKLWVQEPTPCRVEGPEGLSVAELGVYEGLRANRWGDRVRLEQERIAWPAALEAIDVLGTHL